MELGVELGLLLCYLWGTWGRRLGPKVTSRTALQPLLSFSHFVFPSPWACAAGRPPASHVEGSPWEATDNKSGVGGWQSGPFSRRACSLKICLQTSPVTMAGSQLGLGPKSWLISSVFVQSPPCSRPVESLGGHAAKTVEVPGTRILDFFFSKSDRTNNSLHLLANRYIDQSQIQTCPKLNQAMWRESLEYDNRLMG